MKNQKTNTMKIKPITTTLKGNYKVSIDKYIVPTRITYNFEKYIKTLNHVSQKTTNKNKPNSK